MKSIEQMLSLTSQENLGDIIKTYTDEEYQGIDLTAHLKSWSEKKEHIFKLFGNKLSIEKEVDCQLPYTLVQEKLATFLDADLEEPRFNLIKVFLKAISADEVSSNFLERDFQMFDTVFKKGIKVSKCFKHLVKKDYLYGATTKYSMFLQSLKAKGTAVLSIDPIDFLTMSANKSGWRSCHAPDGEYRVGQIAYMMDSVSVISYIKSKDDCELNSGLIHTNKIWRQIVLINDNNSYALQARQYPASNEANALTVGSMLQEVIETWTGKSYKRHAANASSSYFYKLQADFDRDITLFYNDITNTAFDTGYMVIPADKERNDFEEVVDTDEFPLIYVGVNVPCLCGCGNWLQNAEHYYYENDGYDDGYNYDNDNNYDEEN